MPEGALGPARIRELRGERTQAELARLVGVNAHTVYRWELPEDSPHHRRPRGAQAAKLQKLAATEGEAEPALVPVAAALQRILDGQWREPELTLIKALSDRASGPQTRALAATGLALIELMFRADGRRALAALAPALADGAPALGLAEAAAALAYAMPDGELFDLGAVHAHARRAEEIAGKNEAPVVSALAAMAVANAALLGGDDDLMLRALGGVDAIAGASLPELPALFLEHLRSYDAAMSGHQELAMERLERIAANPAMSASPSLEARVHAARALRMLDNLGDPGEALVLARRARDIVRGSRIAVGVHTALTLRAESEALLRLGRLAEVAEVFAESDRIFDELGFPVTIVFPVQQRYLMLIDGADQLDALAEKTAAVQLPSMRPVCQAYAAWLGATAKLSRGTDPAGTMAAFATAERLASGWGIVRRDVLISYASAALVDGTVEESRAILGRALRAVERRPSAWVAAHLRRAEGTLLIEEGRVEEGRMLMEAAAGTFAAASDRIAAALSRYGAAGVLRVTGGPDAQARSAEAAQELDELGVPKPAWIDRAIARASQLARTMPARHAETRGGVSAKLELALQRVAVAGATVKMVVMELAAVARDLLGPAWQTATDEIGETVVRKCGPADLDVIDSFDVVGGGRHFRLCIGGGGVVDDDARRALRILAMTASLALEVSTLRSGERAPAATSDTAMEVPGLVIASPAMKKLIGEVQRLAGSRANVLITGESGAGKEVVARAVHEMSPRKGRAYVAFNCAAVPHDLFEGQLFGYRRGAFTGATADHAGVVGAADGGTLFLDEIGELPLDIQPKLLRFLDAGEVFPLGAQRPQTVDVRVIAATNRDLAAEVARGRFRQDLFYRLHVVPLVVPPLRDRRDDIVPLARHFARLLSAGTSRPPAFAPDALAALRDHPWRGNVRELRNSIERAMAFSRDVVTRADLGI